MNILTTHSLLKLMKEDKIQIVDVRPIDAYNGWPMQNESRGGHIKGARSLPLKWTHYMDWIDIIGAKGLLPEHQIAIYGYKPEEAEQVVTTIFHYTITLWTSGPQMQICPWTDWPTIKTWFRHTG